MNQKSKLTFGKIFERFSYGCGDFGCNIIYTAMSAFLLFSVPASWASTPKLVYVFITYHLVSTVITLPLVEYFGNNAAAWTKHS